MLLEQSLKKGQYKLASGYSDQISAIEEIELLRKRKMMENFHKEKEFKRKKLHKKKKKLQWT